MHWATDYIGKAWDKEGDGVNSFNCWTFVQLIQSKIYGREMPDISIDASNQLAVTRACMEEASKEHWYEVAEPVDGDCMLLSRSKHPAHVGIWVVVGSKSGLLHCCNPMGVVYQNPATLQVSGWGRFTYYRWRNA